MEDKAELESLIRGLLVSATNVLKASRLEQDYYESEGRRFPYRQLGFSSFLDYLKSIPNVVELVPFSSSNPDVLPIVTQKISHIDILVSKQRNTSSSSRKRRSKGFFGSRYNYAPPPPPRRPANYHQPQPRPTPNKGTYVSDIENHIKNKYSREDLQNNGIHSVHDLLSNGKRMVDCVNGKVFPKFSNYPEMASPTTLQPQENQVNCIPAGMEEDFEDEFLYEECDNYGEVYDNKNDSVFNDIGEEAISNYTIQRCTESLHNSKRNVESPKGAEKNEDFKESSYDDHEENFSERMIRNFRSILAKHPEGVWATELPQKYLEECKARLDIQGLGYTSAVEMASYLPNIFVYKRVGSHDWKLFDAHSYNDQIYNLPSHVEEINLKGHFDKSYVPKTILENISLLLDRHPQGIKSTDLVDEYKREFKKELDLDTLGFKVLEDFLEILKDVITVRKATSHYFLLPKHKTLSLDVIDTNQCEELLNVPVEPFEFVGPEDVLKPKDVIPPQELPSVNCTNPLEPLMSLVVRLGEVINPCMFYMMLDSKYNELESMMEDLHNFYRQEEHNYKIILPLLCVGLVCACKYDDLWHRAVITGIRKNCMVDIEYIDYGSPGKVHVSELRFLQSEFAKLPAQAICGKLIGLVPKSENKKWPDESCRVFLSMITQKRIVADVYHINTIKNKEERVQLEVILYDTNRKPDIVLNDYLVEKGLADYINYDQANKEEEINVNQTVPSTNSQQQPPAIETNEIKRLPRIPPGFEATISSWQVQNQDVWCSPNVGRQVYTQTPVQQHWNINNILVAPHESNLRQLQSLMQNPQFNNMQYQGNQSNMIWPQIPQIPFLQSNPYISNAFPTPVQNMCFPPLNYFPPAHVNPTQMKPNFTSSNPNIYHQNQNIDYRQNKVPGYSGDLSTPLKPVPQQIVSPGSYQQGIPVPDRTTPTPVEVNNDRLKRPNLQKTPPISDLLPSLNDLVSKFYKPQPSEYIDKLIPLDKEVNKDIDTLHDIQINTDILSPQNMNSPELTNYASSNDIPSVVELNETNKITQLSEDITSLTLVNEDDKSVDTDNESWGEIEPDDTPATADSFITNFKTYTDSIDKINKTYEIPIVNLSIKSEKTKSGSDLLQSNVIQNTKNWKDIFNPDNFSNSERNSTPNKINSHSEKKSLEKKHIKKLEFKDTFFHLLEVKNKSAVFAEEFFPIFLKRNWQVINKLVESQNKQFLTVNKTDNLEVFSELEKIELCGEVNKKRILKLGKVNISYISDIPSVFSICNDTPDPELLNKLKGYEHLSKAK